MRAYSRPVPWRPPSKRRVRAIRDRLRELYGRPVNHPHGDPVHELVKTILSQNTSDTNRDAAYDRLRERFDTWEEVRDAPVAEVAEAIRPGGLSATKAPRIQAALRGCGEPIDLAWLRDAPRDEAIDFLTSLPGVGRKTAACVLLFSFDRPEIPVDTHVYRVGGRLGLIRDRASFDAGARRAAASRRPRGRLRAAHQPDPPRPRRVPSAAALRAMRAASHVPLLAPPRGGRVSDLTARPRAAEVILQAVDNLAHSGQRFCLERR